MKRLWVAAVLAVLLLGGSIWSAATVTEKTASIAAAVTAGDFATAQRQWDAVQPLFGALLVHDELDKTERLLARLRQAETDGMTDELSLDRAELLAQLHTLPELQRPSIKNLF